jgi:hypothetical protein
VSGLSWFSPESVAFEAGRTMLRRLRDLDIVDRVAWDRLFGERQ